MIMAESRNTKNRLNLFRTIEEKLENLLDMAKDKEQEENTHKRSIIRIVRHQLSFTKIIYHTAITTPHQTEDSKILTKISLPIMKLGLTMVDQF